VDVETDKPDIYGSQYHVLVYGKNTEYCLFSNGGVHTSTVTIEYDIASSPRSPVWKCIGTVNRISVSRNGIQQCRTFVLCLDDAGSELFRALLARGLLVSSQQ